MADRNRTVLSDVVAEGTTALITGTLVDESGVALGSSQLASLTMTLYALIPGEPVINNRTAVNVLNAGPGTVDGSGNWTLTLSPADNDIVETSRDSERHRLLLEWTYGGGQKAGKHEVEFTVRNVSKVA